MAITGRMVMKLAKYLAVVLLSMSAFLVVCVLLVLKNPSRMLNTRTVNWAAHFAQKKGWLGDSIVHWDKLDFQVTSSSFWVKKVDLGLDGFCVDQAMGHICFRRAKVSVEGAIRPWPPRLTVLGPISILGGDIQLDLDRNPSSPAKKSETREAENSASPLLAVPSWLTGAQVRPMQIEVTKAWVKTGGETWDGQLSLTNEAPEALWSSPSEQAFLHSSLSWKIAGRAQNLSKGIRGKLNAHLNHEGQSLLGLWALHSQAEVVFSPTERAQAKIDLRQGSGGPSDFGHWDYRVDGKGSLEGRRLKVVAHGKAGAEELTLLTEGRVSGLSEELPVVHWENCDLSMARNPGLAKASSPSERLHGGTSRIQLNCPIALGVSRIMTDRFLGKGALAKDPELRLRADLRTSLVPSASERIEGDVALELDPIHSDFFDGALKAHSMIAGVPSDFPKDWRLDTDIATQMKVSHFQSLVRFLDRTAWAIPAPLNRLNGSVELSSQGTVGLGGGSLPVALKTRLASIYQKLNLDAKGSLAVTRKTGTQMFLKMECLLSDVLLALPRLNMEAPPSLLPDPRIHTPVLRASTEGPRNAPLFNYQIHLKTPDQRPVRIISNLARADIPIAVDVTVDSSGANGSSQTTGGLLVQNFPIKLFRRDAEIEHFGYRLRSDVEGADIDGAAKITYTDYTIRISVVGTQRHPQVTFVSDPPVSQDQIVAVLLFGRSLDELDPDQSESVGNSRAAFADGAVGLASLYALASTPVESVGYDPTNNVFSAKVRLAEGTSLNVGAGQGQLEQVGIRKRLSRFWTFTTGLTNPSDPESRSLSAFLEWHNRY